MFISYGFVLGWCMQLVVCHLCCWLFLWFGWAVGLIFGFGLAAMLAVGVRHNFRCFCVLFVVGVWFVVWVDLWFDLDVWVCLVVKVVVLVFLFVDCFVFWGLVHFVILVCLGICFVVHSVGVWFLLVGCFLCCFVFGGFASLGLCYFTLYFLLFDCLMLLVWRRCCVWRLFVWISLGLWLSVVFV